MADQTEPKAEGCFVELLVMHQRSIYSFIVQLIHDHADAEDLLQKTLIVMWKKFDLYEPGTDFLAWARQIAKFEVQSFVKVKGRSRVNFNTETIDLLAETITEDSPGVTARYDALRHCLEQLRPADHELIKRSYLSGLAIRQIAVSLERSVESVYQTLHRIRTLLAKCIERRVASEERI
jgi:RNA polymerase sigma-70 factor (ECF subfamily)